MVNREYFALGSRPNKIRELFEYGKRRISVVGEENVFDYSIGNPSIPAPDCVNETAHFLLHHMDSKALHGYTSSVGDLEARQAIAEDLNQRFHAGAKADNLFITCGAAPAPQIICLLPVAPPLH